MIMNVEALKREALKQVGVECHFSALTLERFKPPPWTR